MNVEVKLNWVRAKDKYDKFNKTQIFTENVLTL